MTRFRSCLFWCHLTTAAFVGVVVAIMSVTGVALAYQRQVQYWADTRGFTSNPRSDGTPRLPLSVIFERVRAATGEAPTSVTLRRDPTEPIAVTAGGRTIYANAYSGQVYGEGHGALGAPSLRR